MDRRIQVYTDGACKCNPGIGGYGAIVVFGDLELLVRGGARQTTNNRMELQAVIAGLESAFSVVHSFDDGFLPPIEVYTDSTYVLHCLNHGWRRRRINGGYKTNLDLLKELEALVTPLYLDHEHLITGVHVKGHSGHEYNERCDRLANEGVAHLREIIESSNTL